MTADAVDDAAEAMATPPSTASSWNIANALTILRLLLVPWFAAYLVADRGQDRTSRIAAFALFALASYTDRIDGQLARRHNLVTSFGKLADPIADKALTGTALIGLSLLHELPWTVTVVVLFRELGVTVIAASRGGKLKTLLQGVAIGLYVLPLTGLPASARAAVMAVAVAVTVVTGVDYLARALTLRRTSARADMKRARRAARR